MFSFARLTFARQFLAGSFLILLVGMLIIGTWVAQHIQSGVVQRVGAMTAGYVDSCVAPHLRPLGNTGNYDPAQLREINHLFTESGPGARLIAFKLWSPEGRILFSTDPTLIGRALPMEEGLTRAFGGSASSHITALAMTENPDPREPLPRLIESYAPVHEEGTSKVVAVAEFYQSTEDLDGEMLVAQRQSWAIVGAATLAMYLLLAGLVGRASSTIVRQERERQERVRQLTALVEQNAELNERVHRAAARATDLNERFLRRLSAELHDGPCQDLSLALLRVEALGDAYDTSKRANGGNGSRDHQTIEKALQSALSELRTIATGLWLPVLDPLSPARVAERALHEYECKTGMSVELSTRDLPEEVPSPVKVALYRVLQEALANSYRHAPGSVQQVRLWRDDGHLCAQVIDGGAGFNPQALVPNGHLGLASMRERVELLGGAFDIQSTPGVGTIVKARLPLTLPVEDGHE